MKRSLTESIKKDSKNKIILLSGPRQSGKTTLTRSLFKTYSYFNYDSSEDRAFLHKKQWPRDVEALIFDEIHKMPNWKSWIKGIYDTEGNTPRLIGAGSANLETFSKVGDSLAGRYFSFRLHPIDLEEGLNNWEKDEKEVFHRLYNYSGFPEPFLEGTEDFYRRWQRTHLDIILRQDFLDLFSIYSLKKIELLIDLLKSRVAGSISYATLARDLAADPKSIQSWITMLENIYVVFRVTPYHRNIARAILKEPKLYFYDTGRIKNKGAKLENLVACALLKRLHYLEDTKGYRCSLHYLRTKDGAEVDFLVKIDDEVKLIVEVKTSENKSVENLVHFKKQLENVRALQLVLNLERPYDTPSKIEVRDLVQTLGKLSTFIG